MKKDKCVRCESLERKQHSKEIHIIDKIPLCAFCINEIKEEEDFFKPDPLEEDAVRSEEFD